MLRPMQREPLSSNAVVSAGYDKEAQILEIEFRGGRIYRYREVPAGIFEFLRRTASKGSYIHRMIDGHYPYEEITAAPAEIDLADALRASLDETKERP